MYFIIYAKHLSYFKKNDTLKLFEVDHSTWF